MPAKTPMYLKNTTPKRGKKLRLRDILSGDMISPPLGDMRHSAHVGADGEGDMFGDVGFLRGKMDMLPSQGGRASGGGGPGAGRSHSVAGQLADGGGGAFPSHAHDYSYNGFHYVNSSAGLLKSTVSMPAVVAHEQAPPKPPRLHLEDPAPQGNGHAPQGNGHASRSDRDRHPVPSLSETGGAGGRPEGGEPCRDFSFSSSFCKLVPSSGSFSEASSEDSISETCGPLDPHRGLSLDSDAGLSNEDLRSDRSESPGGPTSTSTATTATTMYPEGVASLRGPHLAMARSDSMAGLNLDLGPSILEDVLGIMERYKKVDERCEL
ncbi:hypothetical protein NHX12_009178 [Muraenolepis orangiensis]|uniref:CRIB domain-containing protein n=1 Tax=Muraenolepis orangiensis TaxID=630683 RepID=A0A9Q0DMZ2_9TELE|nr:hypothetical protein NHX12_009178 [Muraenolepis orangiensis]